MDYPVRNGKITFTRKFAKGEGTITGVVIRDVSGASRIRLSWGAEAWKPRAIIAFAHKIVARCYALDHDGEGGYEVDRNPFTLGGQRGLSGDVILGLTVNESEPAFSGPASLVANKLFEQALKTVQF